MDYPGEIEAIQPKKKRSGKDPKEIVRLNHPLRDVRHLLSVLEAWDWHITVRQALEDDEAWQDDLILIRSLGEKYKSIRQQDEGD